MALLHSNNMDLKVIYSHFIKFAFILYVHYNFFLCVHQGGQFFWEGEVWDNDLFLGEHAWCNSDIICTSGHIIENSVLSLREKMFLSINSTFKLLWDVMNRFSLLCPSNQQYWQQQWWWKQITSNNDLQLKTLLVKFCKTK